MELFVGKTAVSVWSCCCLVSITAHTHTHTQGRIVPARGPKNFGWDPVFQPDDFQQTYAELEPAVKNEISHRYKALVALKEHLSSEPLATKKRKVESEL